MNNSESYSKDLSAFLRGWESGLHLGGAYSRGMNPYTSYAIGVAKHRAWREGFVAGSAEKKANASGQGKAKPYPTPANLDWPGKCPHCGDDLLIFEDRGLHCDGCDDLTAEDIESILSKFNDDQNIVSANTNRKGTL